MTNPDGTLKINLKSLVPKEEEKKYQHYTSSRVSMRLITTTGGRINFSNYEYITADANIIEYLDKEIDLGLTVITKGKLLTHKEADPMEALKQKHIEEYKAEQEEAIKKAAVGDLPDMGNTKTKEQLASGAKPASSATVVNAAKS